MKRPLWLQAVGYAGMTVAAVMILAPLAWLVISSVSTREELLSVPPHWIPKAPTLANYRDILLPSADTPEVARTYRQALVNSLVVASAVTAAGVTISTLAAYSLGRVRFRGRGVLMIGILATRMLPAISIVIPLYLAAYSLGLLDTRSVLVILYLSFTLPFSTWLMTAFIRDIPKELEESARVDGCTRLGALLRVVLPLTLPGIAATAIFTFIMAWDEFFFALVFTSTPAAKTVPVAISEFTGRYVVDYPAMTTGGVLGAAPPVLLALLFHRWFIRGLTAGALKE